MPQHERRAFDDPVTGADSLHAYIQGTWRLASYVEFAEDGSVAGAPLGGPAEGLLIYVADGFMSAQLMRSGRRPFSSGDWFSPTPAELDEASWFVGYSGRYSVDEAAQSVIHEAAVSFFPNFVGQAQVRRAQRTEGGLVLTAGKPLRSGGKMTPAPSTCWTEVAMGHGEGSVLVVTPRRRRR